ncbi:MAG: glutathione peroxidase [Planctomycetota bacterium]|jgi:glutathione peroxidase
MRYLIQAAPAALFFLVSCGTPAPESSETGTEVQTESSAAVAPDAATADAAPLDADTTEASMKTTDIPADSVYALSMKSLSGEEVSLSKYAGKVTVFVNVASKCGYTKQYADLQKLHEELGGEDFALVGIPSNDFGGQEPGSAAEIQAFCSENYGVTFDMLEKVGTKEGNSAIFDKLAGLTGERPGWNFCKYVVSKDGTAAQFYKSGAKPLGKELRGSIDEMVSM